MLKYLYSLIFIIATITYSLIMFIHIGFIIDPFFIITFSKILLFLFDTLCYSIISSLIIIFFILGYKVGSELFTIYEDRIKAFSNELCKEMNIR